MQRNHAQLVCLCTDHCSATAPVLQLCSLFDQDLQLIMLQQKESVCPIPMFLHNVLASGLKSILCACRSWENCMELVEAIHCPRAAYDWQLYTALCPNVLAAAPSLCPVPRWHHGRGPFCL